MQRDARESVSRIGRQPAALAAELDPVQRNLLHLGIQFRTLHEPSWLARENNVRHTRAMAGLGDQARVADGVSLRMLLVDGEVAMLPLAGGEGGPRLAVVIRGGPLLGALDQVFDELWAAGTPFEEAVAAVAGGTRPSEQEFSILSLLAAGATDDGIGRRLGISARTAHRRVRELMARLGVRTRFQAGAQAVRLGWL